MTTVRVTPDQVAAAKLQIALDAAAGRTSSPLIARIAGLSASDADPSAHNQLPLSVKVRLGDGAVVEGAVTEEQLAALASSALARDTEGQAVNILQDAEAKALNIVRNASERWEAAHRDADSIRDVAEQLQMAAARDRDEATQLRTAAAQAHDRAEIVSEEVAKQRRHMATRAEELRIAVQDAEQTRRSLSQAAEASNAREQSIRETTKEMLKAANEVQRAFDRVSSAVQSSHHVVVGSEEHKLLQQRLSDTDRALTAFDRWHKSFQEAIGRTEHPLVRPSALEGSQAEARQVAEAEGTQEASAAAEKAVAGEPVEEAEAAESVAGDDRPHPSNPRGWLDS